MRVFIALAVDMSTFFVPSAIRFPATQQTKHDVEGVAGKTNRFPLLAMAPLPPPLGRPTVLPQMKSGTFYFAMRFSFLLLCDPFALPLDEKQCYSPRTMCASWRTK